VYRIARYAYPPTLFIFEAPGRHSRERGAVVFGRVRALYRYQPTEAGDLQFEEGDIIEVIQDYTGKDWWLGQLRGTTGFFPRNFVVRTTQSVSTCHID
jgi:hypothetical protein